MARRTTRQSLIVSLLASSLLACASQALGLDDAASSYSRALVHFNGGRYQEALPLLDEASRSEDHRAKALYWKGKAHHHLGDQASAERELRAALQADPALTEAALELGTLLVQSKRYGDAVGFLDRAASDPTLATDAAYFRGIARLKLRSYGGARADLERAASSEILGLPSRYYLGLVAYEQRDWSTAKQHLQAVATASPDSDLGREAARVLEKLKGARTASYQARAEFGLQYDDNLNLAPDNDPLGITGIRDARATIGAGADLMLLEKDGLRLLAGYDFFQSVHFSDDDFNLQNHRPAVQVQYDAGKAQLGIATRYDYYSLDGRSFHQGVQALPWVSIPEGDFGRTELFYRYRWRKFFLSRPGFEFRDIRDARNHAAGIDQFIYLGSSRQYVKVGAQYAREDPSNTAGERFGYDGFEVGTKLGWHFPEYSLDTAIGYSFRFEDYFSQSAGRDDREHQFLISIEKPMSERVTLVLGYLGVVNVSNKAAFEYERNIGSISLRVSL